MRESGLEVGTYIPGSSPRIPLRVEVAFSGSCCATNGCVERRIDEGLFGPDRYDRRMPRSYRLATFEEWERAASAGASGDPLWSIQAYRRAQYVVDAHTHDRRSNPRLASAPAFDQLTRALGSISANIAEGYSRSSVADRARFYSYALGSTREALTWYNTLRIELGPVVDDRQALLIQIRRLLLTTLRNMRASDPTSMLTDFRRKR